MKYILLAALFLNFTLCLAMDGHINRGNQTIKNPTLLKIYNKLQEDYELNKELLNLTSKKARSINDELKFISFVRDIADIQGADTYDDATIAASLNISHIRHSLKGTFETNLKLADNFWQYMSKTLKGVDQDIISRGDDDVNPRLISLYTIALQFLDLNNSLEKAGKSDILKQHIKHKIDTKDKHSKAVFVSFKDSFSPQHPYEEALRIIAASMKPTFRFTVEEYRLKRSEIFNASQKLAFAVLNAQSLRNIEFEQIKCLTGFLVMQASKKEREVEEARLEGERQEEERKKQLQVRLAEELKIIENSPMVVSEILPQVKAIEAISVEKTADLPKVDIKAEAIKEAIVEKPPVPENNAPKVEKAVPVKKQNPPTASKKTNRSRKNQVVAPPPRIEEPRAQRNQIVNNLINELSSGSFKLLEELEDPKTNLHKVYTFNRLENLVIGLKGKRVSGKTTGSHRFYLIPGVGKICLVWSHGDGDSHKLSEAYVQLFIDQLKKRGIII